MNYGYNALIINETATELYKTKKFTGNETDDEIATTIVKYQLKKEIQAENYAKNNTGKYVIICDRSIIEPAAYLGIDKINKILNSLNQNFEQVRNSYNLVLHLTTIAKGASEFYTNENNKARKENISEAIDLDNNILQIWSKHPNRIIVNNSEHGFDEKIKNVEEVIANFLKGMS